MSRPVISVENLSKAYRIGLKEEVPDTLTSALIGFAKAPLRKFQELRRLDTFRHTGEADDIVWALKDVSFEVQEGEVLGVIGRNGAGKSTLLKILSRITEPTSGRAVIRGRVSSLLEVGTGFHPELSGRENVYLNGTILGMTKAEIDKKFDEIVDFSGVEKFLDTPVKRYSSGMRVRLAFAVAANLDPEILIIDEVLAVGDGEFQNKCMGKMKDVARGGRTVLFVSHDMSAISTFCTCAARIHGGVLADFGATQNIVQAHIDNYRVRHAASQEPQLSSQRPGTGELRFIRAMPCKPVFVSDEPKIIAFDIKDMGKGLRKCSLSAHLVDSQGRELLQCDSRTSNIWFQINEAQSTGTLSLHTPWLREGTYRVDLAMCGPGVIDFWEGACSFDVGPQLPYTSIAPADATSRGIVFGDFRWSQSTHPNSGA